MKILKSSSGQLYMATQQVFINQVLNLRLVLMWGLNKLEKIHTVSLSLRGADLGLRLWVLSMHSLASEPDFWCHWKSGSKVL